VRQADFAALYNATAYRTLSIAPRGDDSLAANTATQESDLRRVIKQPQRPQDTANGNLRISLMATAAEGAAPSATETQPSPATPEPHWSHLPIWGADAEARGHRIPLPFGVGATFYDAKQPVKVNDLKLGALGASPESTTFVKVHDPIVSWQQNASTRLDVWLFPFLNIYGVAGYTRGNTRGRVTVTGPIFGLLNQEVRLLAEFNGPTVGGGITLAGGFKVADWLDLHVFGIADVNHTVTFLKFKNESLIAETKPRATVVAPRVGLRGQITEFIGAGMWVGGMYQLIQEEVAGSVAGRSLDFVINQRAASPWNTLVGGQIEFGRHFNVLFETGIGERSSILTAAVFRF
jgi:hypothetical protein